MIENEKIATIVKGIWDCIWVFVEESEELKTAGDQFPVWRTENKNQTFSDMSVGLSLIPGLMHFKTWIEIIKLKALVKSKSYFIEPTS